jgi:hypothetical protein
MGGDNDLLFRPAADAPGSAKAGPVALPQHELRCSIRRQSDTGAPATQEAGGTPEWKESSTRFVAMPIRSWLGFVLFRLAPSISILRGT